MTETLLVAGATGGTGGALLASIAAGAGGAVPAGIRAMTRSTRTALPAGAERVIADLDDAESLRRALDGVQGVYLASPSTERAQEQQLRFTELAAAAGVKHLVLLSQLGADADSPARCLRFHAAVERGLAESGIAATVLRSNFFMQSLLAVASLVRDRGLLAAPLGAARVSAIDVRDIGAVAATALLSGRPLGTLTLTGPEALGFGQVAAQLGAAIGRSDVRFLDAPPAVFAAALRSFMPAWQVDATLEDFRFYATGAAAGVSDGVQRVLGHGPLPFTAFARDYAPLFR
ncbi:SDR family oxidoreductase [Schumannella luteola]|uniref:Uncharacterized protein YbjT (DUF2867 family) n=1 Tax=Schumannella luteola TaxID=472059 RepID=A0A852Y3P5_9MICO|nr:NmrA family NAD(P)-binding protein [Schumannella luteola]NYG97526.1 uncharacterized protein YbjT (DUF2867 family) [Schumannella luteola]TPX01546.1 SDR family NAD(P)-dependent oxidoreductase [Schumannella luteola]